MKVKFLGSGDAFGSGGRLQTCIMIESGQKKILVDCGATSLVAMRKFGVAPNDISAIFISHLHGDHFTGIPFFILDGQMISKRTVPLIIAGPPGTQKRIVDAMEVMFPGSSKVERKFSVEVVELELERPAVIDEIKVTSYPMVHPSGDPSTALRIEFDGKIVTYTGDTEWTEAIVPAAMGVDLLISEAYFYDKQVKFHMSYTTLQEHFAELRVKKLVLTHMGSDMLAKLSEISCDYADDGKEFEI